MQEVFVFLTKQNMSARVERMLVKYLYVGLCSIIFQRHIPAKIYSALRKNAKATGL